MSVDPNWRPDLVKVAEHVVARKSAIAAQEVVVARLRDLWDAEDRELRDMRQSLADFQEAVASYVPAGD